MRGALTFANTCSESKACVVSTLNPIRNLEIGNRGSVESSVSSTVAWRRGGPGPGRTRGALVAQSGRSRGALRRPRGAGAHSGRSRGALRKRHCNCCQKRHTHRMRAQRAASICVTVTQKAVCPPLRGATVSTRPPPLRAPPRGATPTTRFSVTQNQLNFKIKIFPL